MNTWLEEQSPAVQIIVLTIPLVSVILFGALMERNLTSNIHNLKYFFEFNKKTCLCSRILDSIFKSDRIESVYTSSLIQSRDSKAGWKGR